MLCGNVVSILHRFRDINTFTVYVTVCDLEKSILNLQVVYVFQFMCKHILTKCSMQ